jgi:hypothetical protein
VPVDSRVVPSTELTESLVQVDDIRVIDLTPEEAPQSDRRIVTDDS